MEIIDKAINKVIDHVFSDAKKKFIMSGIGTDITFNSNGYSKIVIDQEILDKLFYKDIEVYGNDKEFFFIKDNHPIYRGHVDSEGLEDTIKNDIVSTYTFVNITMMIANEDKESFTKLIKDDPSIIQEYLVQAYMGYTKAKENKHY